MPTLYAHVTSHIPVLGEGEALEMLLSYAELGESLDAASEENVRARDIVELCGRLPLTLGR